MGQNQHETTIAGYEYTMRHTGSREAMHLGTKLLKLFSPMLARGTEIAQIMQSLPIVLAGMTEKQLDETVDYFCSQATYRKDGNDAPLSKRLWSEHFKGRLGDLFDYVCWGFEVQFGNFIDMFTRRADEMQKKVDKAKLEKATEQ